MSLAVSTEQRPLRRDAARNLKHLLDAAAELFVEQGLAVSMADIAARAGVGVGTLYRRFPNRDALIAFILDEMLREMVDLGNVALAEPDGGLETFLRGAGELQARDRGCIPRLWQGGASPERRAELRAVIRRLLDQAQAAGTIRPEITYTDISMLLWSLQYTISMTAGIAPTAWLRQLDVLLAGISATPRPITHEPITQQQATAAIDRLHLR